MLCARELKGGTRVALVATMTERRQRDHKGDPVYGIETCPYTDIERELITFTKGCCPRTPATR